MRKEKRVVIIIWVLAFVLAVVIGILKLSHSSLACRLLPDCAGPRCMFDVDCEPPCRCYKGSFDIEGICVP